jgi:hypothetical protein
MAWPAKAGAECPVNEQGANRVAHTGGHVSTTANPNNFTADAQWKAIPLGERFELLATIAEMREWRGKPSTRPIRPAAIELHQWLAGTCDKGPSTRPNPRRLHDASAN